MVDCIYKRLIKVLKENHSIENISLKIELDGAVFNCRIMGNGPEHIIAFHGYGQTGDVFLPLASNHTEYTIYAIDLPFHGETNIPVNSNSITHQEVVNLIDKWINLFAIQKFSVLGFSIGAKFIFPILEKFGPQLSKVWLLAPDGIYKNILYRLATGSSLSKYLFKIALKYPFVIKIFGEGLSYFHLIDKKTLLFIVKSINTKQKRSRLYQTWRYLRKLNFNAKGLTLNNRDSSFAVLIFLGEMDNIISQKQIESKIKLMSNYKVTMLPCCHHDLINYFSGLLNLSQGKN